MRASDARKNTNHFISPRVTTTHHISRGVYFHVGGVFHRHTIAQLCYNAGKYRAMHDYWDETTKEKLTRRGVSDGFPF